MYTILVILIILVSILMCFIVLIQESKGGGLAADYASGNMLLGAPKTTNVIEKTTWGLAIAMVVLSIATVAFLPGTETDDSVVQHMEQSLPAASQTAPATQGQAAPEAGAQAPAQN